MLESEDLCGVLVEGDVPNPDEGAFDLTVFLNRGECVVDLLLGQRNRESEPVRSRRDGGIDTDHFAIQIHEGSSAVSRINGCVGLEESGQLFGPETVLIAGLDIPSETADNSECHGILEFCECIPDGDHEISDIDVLRRFYEFHRLRVEHFLPVFCVSLQYCKVGRRIDGEDLADVLFIRRGHDAVLCIRITYDVLIRQDHPFLVDEESGSTSDLLL